MKKRGFTLIEMISVLVVIGLLFFVLLVNIRSTRERGYDINMEKSVRDMQSALMLYKADYGRYPGENISNDDCKLEIADGHDYGCRNNASNCDGAFPIAKKRRERLLDDIKPFMDGDLSMTEGEFPFCVYYMVPHHPGCLEKDRGFELVFATRATTFDQYESFDTETYKIEGDTEPAGRYCVYPLD